MNRLITITESERIAIRRLYGVDEIILPLYEQNYGPVTGFGSKPIDYGKVKSDNKLTDDLILQGISGIRKWSRDNPFTSITAETIMSFIPYVNIAPKIAYGLIIFLDIYEISEKDYTLDPVIAEDFFGYSGPYINLLFDMLSFFGANAIRKELSLAKSPGKIQNFITKNVETLTNYINKLGNIITQTVNSLPDIIKNLLKPVTSKVSSFLNTIATKLKNILKPKTIGTIGSTIGSRYVSHNVITALMTNSIGAFIINTAKNMDANQDYTKYYTAEGMYNESTKLFKENNIDVNKVDNFIKIFKIDRLKEPNKYSAYRLLIGLNLTQILALNNVKDVISMIDYLYNNINNLKTQVNENIITNVLSRILNSIGSKITIIYNTLKNLTADPITLEYIRNRTNNVLQFNGNKLTGIDLSKNLSLEELEYIKTSRRLTKIFIEIYNLNSDDLDNETKIANKINKFYKKYNIIKRGSGSGLDNQDEILTQLKDVDNNLNSYFRYKTGIARNIKRNIQSGLNEDYISNMMTRFGLEYNSTIQERVELNNKLQEILTQLKNISSTTTNPSISYKNSDVISLLRKYSQIDSHSKELIIKILTNLVNKKIFTGEEIKTLLSYNKLGLIEKLYKIDNYTNVTIYKAIKNESQLVDLLNNTIDTTNKLNVNKAGFEKIPPIENFVYQNGIIVNTSLSLFDVFIRGKKPSQNILPEISKLGKSFKDKSFLENSKNFFKIVINIFISAIKQRLVNVSRFVNNIRKFGIPSLIISELIFNYIYWVMYYFITGLSTTIYNVFNGLYTINDDKEGTYLQLGMWFLRSSYEIIKTILLSFIKPITNPLKLVPVEIELIFDTIYNGLIGFDIMVKERSYGNLIKLKEPIQKKVFESIYKIKKAASDKELINNKQRPIDPEEFMKEMELLGINMKDLFDISDKKILEMSKDENIQENVNKLRETFTIIKKETDEIAIKTKQKASSVLQKAEDSTTELKEKTVQKITNNPEIQKIIEEKSKEAEKFNKEVEKILKEKENYEKNNETLENNKTLENNFKTYIENSGGKKENIKIFLNSKKEIIYSYIDKIKNQEYYFKSRNGGFDLVDPKTGEFKTDFKNSTKNK